MGAAFLFLIALLIGYVAGRVDEDRPMVPGLLTIFLLGLILLVARITMFFTA